MEKENKNSLISIVVPIYNAEKTLKRCIESIINQSSNNWELILINDGSSDKTQEICEHYQKENNRIKLIKQSNQGVSVARNEGVKSVSGKYIIFVDSDDYIEPNTIETLNNVIVNSKKDYELVVFGYNKFKDSQKIKFHAKKCELHNNIDILKKISNRNEFIFFCGAPSGKLFKANIIKNNNIKFDKSMSLGEDTCFVLDYIKNINSCLVIEDCLYDSIDIKGSLSKRDKKDIFQITKKIQCKYNNCVNGKNININLKNNILFRNLMLSINMPIIYNWSHAERKELYNEIRNYDEFKKIKIKDINIKYYKLIYVLLKYKMHILIIYLVKIKNLIRKMR